MLNESVMLPATSNSTPCERTRPAVRVTVSPSTSSLTITLRLVMSNNARVPVTPLGNSTLLPTSQALPCSGGNEPIWLAMDEFGLKDSV
ncbi:hypothetical protein D3C87_1655800 [compost metagenome]